LILTTETLVKGLAAVVIPSLVWVLSLTSDLSRDQQRLAEIERRVLQIEKNNAQIKQDVTQTKELLRETITIVRFIRKELLP
jgi:hypothetical protein